MVSQINGKIMSKIRMTIIVDMTNSPLKDYPTIGDKTGENNMFLSGYNNHGEFLMGEITEIENYEILK